MTAGVCPVELIRFAERLADLSGAEARRYFRNPSLAVEAKADLSPVTDADRGIELALRKEVAAAQPTHGFFGEEFPAEKPDAEFLWVVDPIDGTKAFLAGKPTFGTLIALLQQGLPFSASSIIRPSASVGSVPPVVRPRIMVAPYIAAAAPSWAVRCCMLLPPRCSKEPTALASKACGRKSSSMAGAAIAIPTRFWPAASSIWWSRLG